MPHSSFRSFLVRLFFVMLAALLVIYIDRTVILAQIASGIFLPILLGAALAFVLSIPLCFFERHWFPDTKNKILIILRRPVCILIVIVLLVLLLTALMHLIIPNFVSALSIVSKAAPAYAEYVQNWVLERKDVMPDLAQWVSDVEINWKLVRDSIIQFFGFDLSAGDLFAQATSLIGSVFGVTVDILLALIFMFYFLAGKESMWRSVRRRINAWFDEAGVRRVTHIFSCANETFRSFITGQCVEAVVLGLLCLIGMLIFRFPFAPLVSVLIGVTALLPMLGAYIGAIFGALMIFTVNPLMALWFLVFIIVLQQIEGNLIYPRVVGTSIRLPGVWVLAAVTVGGGIGGIVGILIGVPLLAFIHRLVSENVDEHLTAKGIPLDSIPETAPAASPAAQPAKPAAQPASPVSRPAAKPAPKKKKKK